MLKRNISAAVLVLAIGVAGVARAAQEAVTYSPSLDYKSFVIKQAVKTSERRERVINILTDLLKLYPEGEDKAQLKMRLAQLYLDKARYLYFLELYNNDPDADKMLKGEVAAQKKTQTVPKAKLESSYVFNRNAIGIYRELLRDYPKLKARDEVLFYLAYNLGEIGQNREAQTHYQTLIREYPNSKFVPEAYLVQAEYYFYDDKFQEALNVYRKVLQYKETQVADLARYKIAWCYFNLGNMQTAIKTMEKLTEGNNKTDTELDLRQEALRDLVVMFSYGGYHREAPFYFKQVGGDENYRPMMKQLGNLYFAQGKNGYAQELYKRIIAEAPDDKDNPEMQKRLVDLAKRLGKKEDVVTEASKLVRFYSGDESKWTEKNRNDWQALQNAREMSESTLREIALSLHNEAQKTKDDRTYSLAMAAYREYLDNFPETKDANKIRFYYAESLYKLGKMEQAGIEYTKVLNAQPTGPFALLAAYGAIVSYDEVLRSHGGAKEQKPGKQPTFIPLWEREIVKVSDNFVKYFPHDKRAPQISFKAAKIYYDHNHFKEAVKRFDQLVTDYPAAGTTPFAINLVLDSWNIQEKWDEVVTWGKKYYANPAVPPGKFKQDLYALIERASFKVCRSLEESGKYTEASASYLKFVDEFKGSEFTDDALNNAAVSYRKGRDLQRAIEVFQRLIKEQPNSPFVQAATLAVGKGYEDLAEFADAATHYELYQRRYPDQKNSADLIYNAGVFRENMGDVDRAIVDYRIYVVSYKNEKDVPNTEFAIGGLLEKKSRWAEAATAYSALATKYRGQPDYYITATVKWADMLIKMNDQARAAGLYRQAASTYAAHVGSKRPALASDTVELASKAQFRLIEPSFAAYLKIKLDVPLVSFTPNLQRKIKALDQLIKEYQKVIGYGAGTWVTSSVFRMAVAYDDFALNLNKVREPAMLQPAEREAFMTQIRAIGQNMRAKSIETYSACIEKAAELDVVDPVVAKAEKRLADLSAKPKTEVKEFVHEPIYLEDAIGKGSLL